MHPEVKRAGLLAAVAALAAGSGCTDGEGALATDATPMGDVVVSRHARVKYKDGARYASDIGAALALPRDAICRELGQYDCVDQVHRIVLGGVEPYTLGVREPLATMAVTAPIAQDRVALAACTERIARDIAGSDPVFLTGLDVEAPTPGQIDETAARFYDRILRRAAEPHELRSLAQFYSTVTGEVGATGVAATRDWAILSCFMVATTLESIFY